VNELQQRIERILGKLSRARARRLSCFGSDQHRFRLNAPLGEAELRGFEGAHGIELPPSYRAFLEHAGNGGAGPYYGIFRLENWKHFAGWVLEELPADFLASSSPLRPGRNAGPDRASAAGLLAAYQGTLSIGSQGCSYVMQLIVSGPSRGRVAYVDASGEAPFVVRDEDFLSWYERWLDELLNGYETVWFGFSPPGGEAQLLAVLANAEADPQLKGEAAWAVRRLPRLSEPAKVQVSEYLGDPLAEVRSGACAALRKFAVKPAIERVALLLDDPVAEARREAAWTLMELAPERWADAVRQMMLREPDEPALSRAFFSLKEAGRLSRADMLHIIETTRSDRLRALAVHALDWRAVGKQHGVLATRLLNDRDQQVRFYAALALRRSRVRPPTSTLIACLEREPDPLNIEHLLALLGKQADPAASQVLLQWATCGDDFHRLSALKGLLKIGDRRAILVARRMLQERRAASRKHGTRLVCTSSYSIRSLVWGALLREGPVWILRRLARRIGTRSSLG
jgi:HEAT repeat protein